MNDQDILFMEQALEAARMADRENEVPVGAVLVHDNQVISQGYNATIQRSDPTAHAEIIALREAGKIIENYRLLNTSLYVTLEPCVMCYAAMVHARIENLFYGAPDPKSGIFSTGIFYAIKNIFNHTITTKSGIIEEKSARLLQDFFRARRGAGAVERGGLENR